MDLELFSSAWTGEDELKLLSSLERNGYGNWVDISSEVGKPPEDCYCHYHKYYFNWTDIDVPDFSKSHSLPEHFVCDFGSMDFPGKEITHYNPLRNDFDIEPFNEAEKELKITDCLCTADATPDNLNPEDSFVGDDEIIKHLVLALVDSYLTKLQERRKIKRLIEDYQLLDIYRMLSVEKTLSADQQQVKKIIRPFVRFFHNHDDLSDFDQLLNNELKLVKKIQVLKEYRLMGITKFKAAELYESLKESRHILKEQKKKLIRKMLKKEESFYRKSRCSPTSLEHLNSGTTKKNKHFVSPLDISICSGAGLLLSDEKAFCSVNRILPDIFLRCKKQMILEYQKNGSLRLMEARKICRIDVNKTRKVYNFLIEKEIIRASK